MKRQCSFSLMVCLACLVGFPLFAHENPNRFVVVKPLHPTELQNRTKPFIQAEVEELVKVQKKEESQNNKDLQIFGEPLDSTGLQNKNDSLKSAQSQNRGELRDTAQLQNTTVELQKEEDLQEKTKIKLVDNRLIIENLPEDGILEIYNIMGVKVYNRRVKAGTNQQYLSLPKGYYIIKIGTFTRKIAIK